MFINVDSFISKLDAANVKQSLYYISIPPFR